MVSFHVRVHSAEEVHVASKAAETKTRAGVPGFHRGCGTVRSSHLTGRSLIFMRSLRSVPAEHGEHSPELSGEELLRQHPLFSESEKLSPWLEQDHLLEKATTAEGEDLYEAYITVRRFSLTLFACSHFLSLTA